MFKHNKSKENVKRIFVKEVKAILICLLAISPMIIFISVAPTQAKFSLASGSYPNTYGEGIYTVMVQENTTGAWLDMGYSAPSGNFLVGNKILNWSDWANQGVTQDGTYVYTTNTTIIMKYTKAGVLQSTTDTSLNTTLGAGYGLGGLCWYDSYIYVTAHNSDSSNGTVLKYSDDLVFVAEYDTIEPTVANNLAMGGISAHGGYLWSISDSQTDNANFQITKLDTSLNLISTFEVSSFPITSDWHYQGLDWYGNYIFCNVHDNADQANLDIYYFTGTSFQKIGRLEQPTYTSSGVTNMMSQDISIENDDGTYYIWFASRKAGSATNEVAKYRFLVDYTNPNYFYISTTTDIKLKIRATLNYSRLGLSDNDLVLGSNYTRVNVTVSVAGTTTYQQQNITYNDCGVFNSTLFWYEWEIIFNDQFTTEGTTYKVQITYEIYGWA